MMTSLPAFIAMALCLACSKIPGCEKLSDVFDTLVNSIPIVICAIAAKQVSGLDEVGVVGGIVAGILSVDGGILGGLVIGILAGVLAYYISVFCSVTMCRAQPSISLPAVSAVWQPVWWENF